MNIKDYVRECISAPQLLAFIEIDELRRILRALSYELGTQKALAEALGVSAQYLTDIIHGKREPGETVLCALGLTRRKVYEYDKEQ